MFDKKLIPIYLFLSGAGTGKSRNAQEFHKLALQCFDATYGFNDPELEKPQDHREIENIVQCLKNPYIFHVTLENGCSLHAKEDPWRAIGLRMLYQLLPEYEAVDTLSQRFISPDPNQVIDLLRPRENRALILVVDGLHNIECQRDLDSVVTALGDLAHGGFSLVCATSTVSGPVNRALRPSRRWRVYLPCMPLDPPTVKNRPVFGDQDLLVKVLIADCGGHGRALELLAENIEDIRKNPHAVQRFISQLARRYQVAIPDQETAIAVVRAVMANHTLKRDEIIPGGKKTPDEISQSGLLYFRRHNQMLVEQEVSELPWAGSMNREA